MAVLVELEHAVDRPVEERAVVRHHDDAAVQLGEERFEQVEPGEVEVVGRFVEEEHVEAGEEDRGEGSPCGLAARHRGHRHVEELGRQTDAVDHGRGPRVEVGCPEREVAIECRGVHVVGAGRRRRSDASVVASNAACASVTPVRRAEEGAQRLARVPVGFLRQEADGGGGG